MLKRIIKSIVLPLLLIIITCSVLKPDIAHADPVCTITNYKNTDQTHRIPYLQWRRCYFIGKAFYYLRIFSDCKPENCNWGWARAKRFGPHFISIYNRDRERNIIQLNFTNPEKLSVNLRNRPHKSRKISVSKLLFLPY